MLPDNLDRKFEQIFEQQNSPNVGYNRAEVSPNPNMLSNFKSNNGMGIVEGGKTTGKQKKDALPSVSPSIS